MSRIKIDYGIDLGTTNSAICRMEKGEPVVIKSDVLKDTMPSCISFTKRQSIKTGDSAFNDLRSDKLRALKRGRKDASNSFVEFKRTMATDTRYQSANMARDYSSEELSAEVLKALKSFVSDEAISSAVITVPAKFTVNQKTATLEAAKLAGFSHVELLQEPIAAAMAYGLSSAEKEGVWMVFDFGGGTFDAALIKVEDGIIQVFDTEGDNYLGGKNLDYAIVDKLIIPYLRKNYSLGSKLNDPDFKEVLRDSLKFYAESVKNQLSFKDSEDIITDIGELGEDEEGEEMEIDLTVTRDEAFAIMRPFFQRAVDICKELMERNNLSAEQLNKLILVGGPTHSPLIRDMLREQVTPNIDTSIDPMTAVATGAALYASTIDADPATVKVDAAVKLEVGYESTSVETSEWVSVRMADSSPFDKIWVELSRNDGSWSSGKVEIDKHGNVIEAALVESRPNSFAVKAYDSQGNAVKCFPEEITIIQGTKVGAAPLPYNIGIATWNVSKSQEVFRMAKGLEKNKPMPAVGVVNGLRTPMELRPGIADDVVKIPVYQVDDYSRAEGKLARLYAHVANVVITGDDVDEYIPIDSLVDITIKVNSSEQMTIEAHFLGSDATVAKTLDTTKKHSVSQQDIDEGIAEADRVIGKLEQDGVDTKDLKESVNDVKREACNNNERMAVMENLKRALRKINDKDSDTEWDRIELNLHRCIADLEQLQSDRGTPLTASSIALIKQQSEAAIKARNVTLGRQVLEQAERLHFSMTMLEQCIRFLYYYNDRFGSIHWKDASLARNLINRGIEMVNKHAPAEEIHRIACDIFRLVPDSDRQDSSNIGRTIIG